jgi:hypothetical protein
MHTLQLLLVEANSHQGARETVSDALSSGQPSWSDWHEATGDTENSFAGRWVGGELLGERAFQDTLRYTDDYETAEKVISEFSKYRYDEISNLRQKIYSSDNKNILFEYNYDHEATWEATSGMDLYYVRKLVELLYGTWISDSGVFDISTWDTNLAEFRKRIDTNPEKQFLVLVDFHH